MKTGHALIIVCALTCLVACDEDKDPLKRPVYQRGYSDGMEDGKATVCKKIYNYSRDIHGELSNEGICR